MLTSRTVQRSARVLRAPRVPRQQSRFQSTSPSSSSNGANTLSPAVTGGITGGAVVFLAGYAWYRLSGTKSLIDTTQQTKAKFNNFTEQAMSSAPEPNEALEWLRETATSYAGFIPGAKGYVDAVFNDLDQIRSKHGDEVDKIVSEAYEEFRDVTKNGLSWETAQKAWDVLQKHLGRISELAADSAQAILDNHPTLKNEVGGDLDQLKSMADNLGPEAKKQVDETWNEISSIIKSGAGVDTANRLRKLVQDKMQKMRELGDEAWKKGMEKAKPYLDKSPQVKEMIEKNVDSLKQGNVRELYVKVKQAVDSGSTEDLENYIKRTAERVKNKAGGGIDQYLKMIPGGSQILPKISELQRVAQEHGKEAEKIVKETFEEIQEVLKKRVGQVQQLREKAKEEAK